MPFAPTAYGFPPGTPFFQPAALFPHPLLAGHPSAAQAYPQQQYVFATTGNNGHTPQFFQAHAQPNYAFPFILTPQTPPSSNPETPLVSFPTPTSAVPTTDSTTFSAWLTASSIYIALAFSFFSPLSPYLMWQRTKDNINICTFQLLFILVAFFLFKYCVLFFLSRYIDHLRWMVSFLYMCKYE